MHSYMFTNMILYYSFRNVYLFFPEILFQECLFILPELFFQECLFIFFHFCPVLPPGKDFRTGCIGKNHFHPRAEMVLLPGNDFRTSCIGRKWIFPDHVLRNRNFFMKFHISKHIGMGILVWQQVTG